MSYISRFHNLQGLNLDKRNILVTSLHKLETDQKPGTIYALLYKEKGDWMMQVVSGSEFRHIEPRTADDSFEVMSETSVLNAKIVDYFLGERGQVFHNLNRIVEALRLRNNGRVFQRY